MAVRMLARTRQIEAEDGFILIEVLVSALILAIVAGAVLTLITATTRSAASVRNHSVAYDLAQEDQARMRTMRLASLNHYAHTATPIVEENEYTVESQGEYINNNEGSVSCTEANDSSDYVQLTSTVTGPSVTQPVTIQSVVSPSNSSADPNRGTLSVQASNALGEPVQGVSVKINEGVYQGVTEANGCANFAELPGSPPNYKVKFEATGLINPKGEASTVVENVAIAAGGTTRIPTSWDKAGTLTPTFEYLNPSNGAPVSVPVDAIEVFNAESGRPATTIGSPGGVHSPTPPTLTIPPLFPFKSKYVVYAGSCTTNNPDPEGKTPANDVGIGAVEVLPGLPATVAVQVPTLALTVKTRSGTEGKSGAESIVQGAKVTVTDAKCPSASNGVKRTYVSNALGGLSWKESGPTEPALPFGTYKVCASKTIGSEVRRAETEVKVESFAVAGNPLTLFLTKGSSQC